MSAELSAAQQVQLSLGHLRKVRCLMDSLSTLSRSVIPGIHKEHRALNLVLRSGPELGRHRAWYLVRSFGHQALDVMV